jgi:hypothetical protein
MLREFHTHEKNVEKFLVERTRLMDLYHRIPIVLTNLDTLQF